MRKKVYMQIQANTLVNTQVEIGVYDVKACVCIQACMCLYVDMHVYICGYIYICIYIYAHIEVIHIYPELPVAYIFVCSSFQASANTFGNDRPRVPDIQGTGRSGYQYIYVKNIKAPLIVCICVCIHIHIHSWYMYIYSVKFQKVLVLDPSSKKKRL